MELLKNLEGMSADEQMTAVVELQKAAMKHLEEQKQASIGKSAELVIQGLKKIKADFEAKFDSLNSDIQAKVANLKDGQQGLQGEKGEKGDRGLDGANGRDGRDGKDGRDGQDGVDGVGVRDAKIDFDGSLVISLTDGREINCGEVVSVDVAKQIQKVTHNIQTGAGGDSQTVLDAIAALQATIATYGTMATQNANNVAITGGNINGTTIGGTTPAAGTFTTLTGNSTSQFGKSSANYVQVVGATAGSSPILSTQGSDTNIDLALTPKGTGSTVFNTALGVGFKVVDPGGGGAINNYWQASGYSGAPGLAVAGSGSNVSGGFTSKGTGSLEFKTNGFSQLQFTIVHTASAVNYVQVTGAATTGSPVISAQGSDTNISLQLRTKGTGDMNLMTAGGTNQVVIRNTTSAVNFISLSGSATGFAERMYAEGSDSNIALAFQSKGTGAIDLAAGSSGVNISNGGTVTAITRTSAGSGYTSIPTPAISAPTTAGGVQATMSITGMAALGTAVVVNGGTGYTAGDVLTPVGGTGGSATRITVSSVSGGVITAASITANSDYTVLPTNPVSVTGGTGSGATFNLNYAVTAYSITNAGSGYVEQPTVSFSGGGGSGAAAYATVGSGTVVRGIGSTLDFYTPSGTALTITDIGVPTVNRIQITGNSASGNPAIRAIGSTNVNMLFSSNGTGYNSFYTSGFGAEQLRVSHTASAVNYVQVTGGATGGGPTISAQGSDSNITLGLQSKGVAAVALLANTKVQFDVYGGSSSVNYIRASGSAAGFAPSFQSLGSDTNIDLAVTPKGTGALVAQASDGGTTINARGANAVDLSTSRYQSNQVASGAVSVIAGGYSHVASGSYSGILSGNQNITSAQYSAVVNGVLNNAGGFAAFIGNGQSNSAAGYYNFIGGGFTNSGTSGSAVTTQSGTMNATTAVTLSGSNANIKVGQYITGTSISSDTYVAAISGTSLTLSKNASGSSTSTLSFYTPHGVVVGGGNNQATGAYSFIGGGGDAGTAGNRNVASGDWSFVGGGVKNAATGLGAVVVGGGIYGAGNYFANTASGISSFVGGGTNSVASGNFSAIAGGLSNAASGLASFIGGGDTSVANGAYSSVLAGERAITRGLVGNAVFGAGAPIALTIGAGQAALLVLNKQTTDATATVLTSDTNAAGTLNQVILPNNSAYYFRGEVISGVTGGGNTKGWYIEGVIKRGANAASTALVGIPTVTSNYADVGASTWTIAVTADTTNGGLAVTFTGQASTTIRTVARINTVEMTF